MKSYMRSYLIDVKNGVKRPLAMPVVLPHIVKKPGHFQVISAVNILLGEFYCRLMKREDKYLVGINAFMVDYESNLDDRTNKYIVYAEDVFVNLKILDVVPRENMNGYRGLYVPETNYMALSADGTWTDEIRNMLHVEKVKRITKK